MTFKKKAEAIFQYLQKGSLVFIQEYQKTDIWEDNKNKTLYFSILLVILVLLLAGIFIKLK